MNQQKIISVLINSKASLLESAAAIDSVLNSFTTESPKRKKKSALTEDDKRSLREAMKKTELRRSNKH